MKKSLVIILVIMLCISLIACGGPSIEGQITSWLHGSITWRVRDDVGVNPDDITFSVQETGENTYTVTGTFTVNDKPATYTVKCEYDEVGELISFNWRYK